MNEPSHLTELIAFARQAEREKNFAGAASLYSSASQVASSLAIQYQIQCLSAAQSNYDLLKKDRQ